jgi:hypothetical protein
VVWALSLLASCAEEAPPYADAARPDVASPDASDDRDQPTADAPFADASDVSDSLDVADRGEVAPDATLPDITASDAVTDVAAPDVAPLDVAALDVTPDAAPDAAPDAVPDSPPDARVDAAPDIAPDVAPDVALDVRPDASPDAAPDAIADAAPDARPDVGLDATPDVAADAPPDARPDAAPDVAPDAPPDVAPDVAPDAGVASCGFSARLAFTLPAGYAPGAFNAFSDTSLACAGGGLGDPSYSLIDLDGDGQLDLVMSDSCTDAQVGTSRWVMNRNTGTGFTVTSNFALPPGYASGAFNAFSDTSLACGGGGLGDPSYALVDLDGDGRPDFVMTDSCTDPQVGTSRWVMHRNTGTGFDPTPTTFALPPGYATGAFNTFSDTSRTCGSGGLGDPSFALVDLDGDRRPDFVMTDSCTDPQVGTSRWVMHRNTGTGFAPTPVNFPLPPGYATGAFNAFSDTSLTCGSGGLGDPSYGLVDLDGDGRLDFVMTDSCTDAQVGTARWVMHRNTGAAFDAMPTLFTLPPGYAPGAFNTFSDTSLTCGGGGLGDPSFALVDLDGDRRPDLAMSDSCTDPQVGSTRWAMHRNLGLGFAATITPIALPAGHTAGAFNTFSDTSLTCGGGEGDPSFALLDLAGDRRLDLVMSDSCTDAQVGTSRWIVYTSTCPP